MLEKCSNLTPLAYLLVDRTVSCGRGGSSVGFDTENESHLGPE
jgi:hypothetical protein